MLARYEYSHTHQHPLSRLTVEVLSAKERLMILHHHPNLRHCVFKSIVFFEIIISPVESLSLESLEIA